MIPKKVLKGAFQNIRDKYMQFSVTIAWVATTLKKNPDSCYSLLPSVTIKRPPYNSPGICIYIYIHICVCVCVCVNMGHHPSHMVDHSRISHMLFCVTIIPLVLSEVK